MAPPDVIARTLDSVKPFWNTDAGPIFPPEAMRALERVDDEPLTRRFAAVEALFQGGWTSWRDGDRGPAIAHVMAEAIAADQIHNRWGLPGHFVGRSGKDLLSIRRGVDDALTPLLEDERPLAIVGSETATVAEMAGYRISDLASYLIATYRGETWSDKQEGLGR
jgi:hypothetical protein